MEPGDSGSRQSHRPSSSATTTTTTTTTITSTTPVASISAPEHHQKLRLRQRQSLSSPSPSLSACQHDRHYPQERQPQHPPAMATATVLAPSPHYPSRSSYSTGYVHHSSSVMIASDPRRVSDGHESPTRQSLPSISEVISATRPAQYSSSAQPALPSSSGLPSPFPQYHDSDKHPSPQPLHPASFPQRQETLPAFVDSPRPPFNGRHSLPPVSDRRATPPIKSEIHHAHAQKATEPRSAGGTYSHPAPTSHPYQPGQLPSGQVPLPSYPISPRHSVPVAPGQYDTRAPTAHPDEMEYASRARYDASVGGHFETWSYQESLSRIGSSSRTVFNFAEAYSRIAREQHGSQPIPERLPTEREVADILANVEAIKRSLEQVKDIVQASIQSERAREGTKMKSSYEEDHDMPMYGDAMKPQYAMQHEVKKRRGRAAPPGRCHSCNRIDTPEWRRGPDGARTLCNACGLHYAKLERRRQLEARSIRTKSEERN